MMRRKFVTFGLATGALLLGLGLGGAEASVNKPIPPQVLGVGSAVSPAAMCGYSCRNGGFYIPGPPEVCFARGLNYCGSSRGWGGPPPWAGYGGGPGRIDPDFPDRQVVPECRRRIRLSAQGFARIEPENA